VRAVEVGDDRRLIAVERPVEVPEAGQALLEVAYCGICGSDLHFRDVPELFPAGTVPGHELTAQIVALGDGGAPWRLGERVCVLPFAQCGECELCRSGQEQVCPEAIANGIGLGTGRPGGYAEQVIVDTRMLFSLPDSVDDRAGALTEPLAVAVRAVEQAALTPDEPAMVVGAGTIGVLTALVLADRGFEQVVLVSRNVARARLASGLGLRTVSPEHAAAAAPAPACVFECAGTPAAARLAVEAVRALGTVMLVGISLEPLDLAAPALLFKEVALRGVLAYSRGNFAAAIELLAERRIPVEALITATAPLEDTEAMFQALSASGNTHMKILLAPREPPTRTVAHRS
jgi:(R,R)-butanediol dehydrogenase / meso-butanediol dehydrogenase / diacetyl reductase